MSVRWQGHTELTQHLSEKAESRVTKRSLHFHIWNSIIDKSQKVEATQVSTDGGMGKPSVAHPHSGL